ncbi:MAG: Dyp-type peroxidase [Actinomycetota bacterium]|nr:Dyp-type peroxidase [Actinomycetota bacterium]
MSIEVEDAQGLVASAYGHLPHGCFLLLEIVDPAAARGWLTRLAGTITTAAGRVDGEAVNMALTPSGLEKLGVPASARHGFSREFQDGMTESSRRRVLGDTGDSAPEYWAWGSPDTAPIDLVLLIYASTPGRLDQALDGHGDALRVEGTGLREVHRLDARRDDREHFGFHDGISQPVIDGLNSGPTHPARDTIKAGEFLLGYENEYGQFTARPLLDPAQDPERLLPLDAQGSGRHDLGRNGTYLVLRQLAQDVSQFWTHVEAVAQTSDNGYGDATALAARMVGRWPNGAPLVLSPERDDPALSSANDFTYHQPDQLGLRCPIGAHVRRSHPRDSLDPNPGSDTSIAIDRRHRLLRRGRVYGPRLDRTEALRGGDQEERGLHFMCVGASLSRQFEFIQHTWVLSPKFDGLYEDADPLIGPAGRTFTIQARPTRRRVRDLPAFVQTRGGAYFFMPGIRALRWLASGAPGGPGGVS